LVNFDPEIWQQAVAKLEKTDNITTRIVYNKGFIKRDF
jgi:hypothetical protein